MAEAGEHGAMTIENTPTPSPRRRERPVRNTGPSIAPLPRLDNPLGAGRDPDERAGRAHPRRRASPARGGGAGDPQRRGARDLRARPARSSTRRRRWCGIGRDIVEAALATAPERFVLHARNPARDLHVGGNVVNFGPVNGAPNIRDLERGRRYGDIEAFRDVLKVANGLGVLHWQGGVVVEPVDVPVPTRHLDMYLAHIELADIVWAARGVGGVQARGRAGAVGHRASAASVEDLAARPTLMTVTNVNSPRRVDEEILDNIMIMARARPMRRDHALHPDGRDGAGDAGRRARPADGRGDGHHRAVPDGPARRALRDGRLHLECRHAHRLARLRHAGICPCRAGDGADRPPARRCRCGPARSMPARRPTRRRPRRPASRSGRRS